MAQNLNELRQELEKIKQSASSSKDEVARLRGEIERTFSVKPPTEQFNLQKLQQDAVKASAAINRLKQELSQLILQQTRATQAGVYNIPFARGREVAGQVAGGTEQQRFRLGEFGRATIHETEEMARIIAEINQQERIFASRVQQLNATLGTLVQTAQGFTKVGFPQLPAGRQIPQLGPGAPVPQLPPGQTPITDPRRLLGPGAPRGEEFTIPGYVESQRDFLLQNRARVNAIKKLTAIEERQAVEERIAGDNVVDELQRRADEVARQNRESRSQSTRQAADLKEPTTRTETPRARGRQPAPPVELEKLQEVLGVRNAESILKRIGESGFTREDIKRVIDYGNSYKQVQVEARDTDRVLKRLVLTVDQAGNVFTSTQKTFRTFFSAISRNVTEMIKWSAATLLVWGSIRKLSELLQIAIKNETELANIAVILGRSHADLGQIFEDAAEAAAATGESIDGVLEGYSQAYRATGNIGDATERARVAQQLLIDSLVLSRLSTLNQAQSMDTLTGALRQAGLELDQGAVLLDKWVAVSRAANVGLDTLAESFAITATSAGNAGLDIDELNGIIATISEVTTLSATESGNAIRAFISGFTTDAAVRELSQFGIAVEDTSGEARGFLDVMEEISAMSRAGIISDAELNKIARAIGGGARREAQVVATIRNLGRAQEVAAVSAAAQGEAEEALAIQLETVQTAITRLSNSFQVLARTLGDEGGVLELTKGILTILEAMVKAVTNLVKALGDLTPILAAVGLGFAVTSKQSRELFSKNLLTGIGANIPILKNLFGTIERGKTEAGKAFETRVPGELARPGFGPGGFPIGGQLLAGGFTAVSAIQDVREGNVAGAVSSVAGGIIGALVSGGNPVGIVIGTAAGEAFANAAINYKTDFENFFRSIFTDAATDGITDGATESQKAVEDVFSTAGSKLTLGLVKEGAFAESIGKLAAKVASFSTEAFFPIFEGIGLPGGPTGKPGQQVARGFTPEQFGLFFAGEEERQRITQLREQQQAAQGFEALPSDTQLTIVNEQKELLANYEEFLSNLEATASEEVRARALAGDINERQLRDALEQIPKLQAAVTRYFITFGEGFQELNPEIQSAEQAFESFSTIVIAGSQEQVEHLNTLANEIAAITNQIEVAKRQGELTIVRREDDPSTKGIDETLRISVQEAEELRNTLVDGAAEFATAMENSIRRAAISLPSIVTLDIRAEDLQEVFTRAQQLQSEYIAKTFEEGLNKGLTEEDIRSTFEPIMVQAGENGGLTYAQGFMQQFLAVAVEQMQAAGEILRPAPAKIPLRTLNVSSAEFPDVMARYQQLAASIQNQLSAQGIEWSPDEETFAGLFTDFIAQPITADLTLLNLAMQELIDVNKKQLEGVYNLPTDASFFVPFQGYKLGFDGGGGGGGLPGAAENLNRAAEHLERAVNSRAFARPYDMAAQLAQDRRLQSLTTWDERRARMEILEQQRQPETEMRRSPIERQFEPDRDLLQGIGGKRPVFEVDPTSIQELIRGFQDTIQNLDFGKLVELMTILSLGVPVKLPGGVEERDITKPRFDEELPLTAPTGTSGDLLRTIRDTFTNIFRELAAPGLNADLAQAGIGGGGGVTDIGIFEKMNSVFDLLAQKISNLSGFSTNLRIQSTTTTNLIVDGRTLANIIKPYLYQDMIRFEDTATSINKNIVV